MLDHVAPSAVAVANPGDQLGVVARVRVSTGTGVTARVRIGMRVRVERRVDRATLMRAVKRTAMVLAALVVLLAVGVSRPAAAWAPEAATADATSGACAAPDDSDDGTEMSTSTASLGSGSAIAPLLALPAPTPPVAAAGPVERPWPDAAPGRCPRPPAHEHPVSPD